MSSIVIELQRDALNKNVLVSDLLRKSLVAATKLNLPDFKMWIDKEMSAYKATDDFPEYREVTGQVKAFNPYQGGWIPVGFQNPKQGENFSKRKSGQSIAQLESLLQGNKNDQFAMPFSMEVQNDLRESMNYDVEVTLFVQRASLVHIIETVRTIILNWTLKLEEGNILGEGMTFTTEEKRQASSTTYNNVNNFHGNVTDSQVQQGSPHSTQNMVKNELDLEAVKLFLDAFTAAIQKLSLSEETQKEVTAEMATIKGRVKFQGVKVTGA
jgi:hypothetical protein